jgi:Tfp pilus assembly protein PilO
MSAAAIVARANASPRATLAATVGAMLLLVAAAWFLVIAPKYSEAGDLDAQIAQTEAQLGAERSSGGSAINPATVRSLQRAMPDQPQVSEVVRQLNKFARSANVTLDTVTPQAPVTAGGHQAIPMTVVVAGRFPAVRQFLRKVRLQVRVRGPKNVDARARLYDVKAINFEESTSPRPNVRATLTVQAFVFAPGSAPATASPTTTPAASAAAAN